MVREHVAWRVWVLMGAVGALAATAAAALLVGEFPVPWLGVAKALGEPGTSPQSVDFMVWEVRVPRLLAGAASGAAFGVAAALLQTAWRTPLAGPRTAGMGGAAMLAIVLAPELPGGTQGPLGAATAGAIGAAAAGLGLGLVLRWRRGSAGDPGPGTALVAGTALDVLCTVAALWLVVSAAGGVVGPLAHRLVVGSPLIGVEHAPILSALCAAAALLGAAAAWRAPAVVAAGPWSGRMAVVCLAALPVGAGVALAGPMALAGVAGGGVAWLLMSGHPGWTALLAGPLGALVVLASDLVARSFSGPEGLPTGYVTVVVGVVILLAVRRASTAAARGTSVRAT
ncbi:hypothetical protein GCM10009799_24940 [Nocardiopsis rhodophaea]|uniref:Iron ABC transporter permease n=1 Tax=Nocardiopsis rhodophaea TaxID=280238 RepID=A0ABP5EEQ7_9ACTN